MLSQDHVASVGQAWDSGVWLPTHMLPHGTQPGAQTSAACPLYGRPRSGQEMTLGEAVS